MYKIQFYIMVLSIKWKKVIQIYLALCEEVIALPLVKSGIKFFGKLGSISLATPRPDYCQTC